MTKVSHSPKIKWSVMTGNLAGKWTNQEIMDKYRNQLRLSTIDYTLKK